MNVLLFLVTLIIAFVVVRIGAITFHLTGLEWSLAKFQSLSCFSGTGFITKESELITGNPQRRRIASVLIVLGHAGLITLVATFANSLRPHTIMPKINIPFIHLVFPSWLLPWINLLIIVISIYAIAREDLTIPNPNADTKIALGDKLICFGKLENIRNKLCVLSK